MTVTNQQILLVRRPAGIPRLDDFQLVTTPVPELKDGEILLRTEYCSLDPYMRARMSDIASYLPPFQLGAVIEGTVIATIQESKSPDWQVGQRVLARTGWQQYAILNSEALAAKDKFNIQSIYEIPMAMKPSYFLGALGMTGQTAYHGLMNIGQPKSGETVVVSAATGAVGSIVSQLAKLKGCRVVGIAGGTKKCDYAVKTLGLDACVDHNSKAFAQDLKAACPSGIDIYFENIGGDAFWAVLPLLNSFARIPICGAISWYNDLLTLRQPGMSLRLLWAKLKALCRVFLKPDKSSLIFLSAIGKRLTFQGFIIGDHFAQYSDFLKEIIPLVQEKKIVVNEDIVQGLEHAPEAFIGLFKGKNFGKLIIQIGNDVEKNTQGDA